MPTLSRTITTGHNPKQLVLSVNNVKLSSPWNQTKFYLGDKVEVVVEKKAGSILYSVKSTNPRLVISEPWKAVKYDGVSNPPN